MVGGIDAGHPGQCRVRWCGLKITEILKTGPSYSFEFFPPRDEKMEGVLAQTLRDLEPLRPSYVSVTYGAGGTTRERPTRSSSASTATRR